MKTTKYGLKDITDTNEGLSVGDRIILEVEVVRPVVEQMVNKKVNEAYNEYFKVLTKTPVRLIQSKDDKKLALEWAFEGVSHEDIMDRLEAMRDYSNEQRELELELEFEANTETRNKLLKKRSKENTMTKNGYTADFY